MTTVCVAGATGWTGRPIAEAVLSSDDLALRAAVSRSSAGQDLGVAWGGDQVGVPVERPTVVVSRTGSGIGSHSLQCGQTQRHMTQLAAVEQCQPEGDGPAQGSAHECLFSAARIEELPAARCGIDQQPGAGQVRCGVASMPVWSTTTSAASGAAASSSHDSRSHTRPRRNDFAQWM